MGAHSLLEDMYGNNAITGTITAATSVCGGQLTELTTTLATADIARRIGCVLTITGYYDTTTNALDPNTPVPDYRQSTRIVGFDPSNNGAPQILTFPDGASLAPTTNASGHTIQVQFTINGTPFSGTGFGYNTGSGALDAALVTFTYSGGSAAAFAVGDTVTVASPSKSGVITQVTDGGATGTLTVAVTNNSFAASDSITDANSGKTATIASIVSSYPIALLPNLPPSAYYNAAANPSCNPPGGANSDYTAADFQHMLLAAQVPNGSTMQTLPSLHRPALINYWINSVAGSGKAWSDLWTANPDLCRKISLRPIGSEVTGGDHPNFTGSNTKPFNPTDYTTWDVDNDGDGVPDSIWVDLGFAVRSTADGHLYKPLFAILCTDLDGRLNLNAHGSLAQTQSSYYGTGTGNNVTADSRTGTNQVYEFGGLSTTATLPRGQGYGVAEINLRPLFAAATNPLTSYQQLLGGSAGPPVLDGRYGDVASTPMPSQPNQDWLEWNKLFDYPDSYPTNTNTVFGDYFSSLSPAARPGSLRQPARSEGHPGSRSRPARPTAVSRRHDRSGHIGPEHVVARLDAGGAGGGRFVGIDDQPVLRSRAEHAVRHEPIAQ